MEYAPAAIELAAALAAEFDAGAFSEAERRLHAAVAEHRPEDIDLLTEAALILLRSDQHMQLNTSLNR